jgi:putative membrane protein insertion efficiency factor
VTTSTPTRAAVAAVRLYQLTISRLLPSSCRFYPSCSEYTRQAIEHYGLVGGVWLGVKRLARCHPFNPGGYDPVPLRSR